MLDIDTLSKRLKISQEQALEKFEHFLEYAQIQLANLEDAIEAENYSKMIKYCHRIGKKASKLELNFVTIHTEHIEILATFKRDTDYKILFEELRASIQKVHESLQLNQQLLNYA